MEKELEKLLKKLRGEAGVASPTLLPLIDKFIESCKGGKRVRGKLVVLGYQLADHLPGVRAHLEGEMTKVPPGVDNLLYIKAWASHKQSLWQIWVSF